MSALKTGLLAVAGVAAAVAAVHVGGFMGLILGVGAIFAGVKAWGSHKESVMESSSAMAFRDNQMRADSLARSQEVYMDNGMGRSTGRWVDQAHHRGGSMGVQ